MLADLAALHNDLGMPGGGTPPVPELGHTVIAFERMGIMPDVEIPGPACFRQCQPTKIVEGTAADALDAGIVEIDARHFLPMREPNHLGGGDAPDSPAWIDRGEISRTWHEHISRRSHKAGQS